MKEKGKNKQGDAKSKSSERLDALEQNIKKNASNKSTVKFVHATQGSSFKDRQKQGKEPKKAMTKEEGRLLLNRAFVDSYKPAPGAKVRVIPLGGLDQIGNNITLIEDDDDIIIVYCGTSFPDDELLGIDLVIPDFTYLKENAEKIRGIVITHGHEDHIGGVPYLLRELHLPVYATKLALALIKHKLEEQGMTENDFELHLTNFGDVVRLGNMYVEYIKTNHSIVDSAALAIYTKAGIIFHTGDFKVDYTPVFGDAIDLRRYAALGAEGVLAVLSDSTNAIKPGFTMSERVVGQTFDQIFSEHKDSRIIVATFASNVDRVRQVLDKAIKYGRKVAIEGRSMVQTIDLASQLGYIDLPANAIVDSDLLKAYPDEQTVIITTGSQGESMAALSRMANGSHKKISIKPSDVIVLSSTPIPGNEKSVAKVINELSRKHATIIMHETHVSGHACAEEIKLIYSLLSPKFAVPMHGEYRHRKEAASLAVSCGVKGENALIIENGDVLELSSDAAELKGSVTNGKVFVDGLGIGDVGSVVLRDRQALSQNGIIIASMVVDARARRIISGPNLTSRGFIYVKESIDLIDECRDLVIDVFNKCAATHGKELDLKKLQIEIRMELGQFLWKRIKRQPMILPLIMEIEA